MLGFDMGVEGGITQIRLAAGALEIPALLVLPSSSSFLFFLIVGALHIGIL